MASPGKFPSSSTHILNRIFQNYLNCIEKGQKEHTKCYMISNPTPKFTSQIRSIRSVFGRNRTGTGSEKIDRIDRNRNRNRISGRTLFWACSGYLAKLGLIWTKYGRGCPAGTVWRLGSGTPSKVRSLVLVCWSTAISKSSFTKKYPWLPPPPPPLILCNPLLYPTMAQVPLPSYTPDFLPLIQLLSRIDRG